MLVLTDCVEPDEFDGMPDGVLRLTADQRRHVRRIYRLESGASVKLELTRGLTLKPKAWVTTPARDHWIQIQAQPEPVLVVKSEDPLTLLQAAYHLGNRHVPLEIDLRYLKLEPDPVLKHLLVDHLRLQVTEAIAPFEPDPGAYHSSTH